MNFLAIPIESDNLSDYQYVADLINIRPFNGYDKRLNQGDTVEILKNLPHIGKKLPILNDKILIQF